MTTLHFHSQLKYYFIPLSMSKYEMNYICLNGLFRCWGATFVIVCLLQHTHTKKKKEKKRRALCSARV